jgi:hypothetical protein
MNGFGWLLSSARYSFIACTNSLTLKKPNRSLGQLGKPTLRQIQTRRTGGSEMQMKAPMMHQPTRHLGMLVRPVIVQDEMKIQLEWKLAIEPPQKVYEFLVPMARLAVPDDRSLEHI